jgi:hypothetical protein
MKQATSEEDIEPIRKPKNTKHKHDTPQPSNKFSPQNRFGHIIKHTSSHIHLSNLRITVLGSTPTLTKKLQRYQELLHTSDKS